MKHRIKWRALNIGWGPAFLYLRFFVGTTEPIACGMAVGSRPWVPLKISDSAELEDRTHGIRQTVWQQAQRVADL